VWILRHLGLDSHYYFFDPLRIIFESAKNNRISTRRGFKRNISLVSESRRVNADNRSQGQRDSLAPTIKVPVPDNSLARNVIVYSGKKTDRYYHQNRDRRQEKVGKENLCWREDSRKGQGLRDEEKNYSGDQSHAKEPRLCRSAFPEDGFVDIGSAR